MYTFLARCDLLPRCNGEFKFSSLGIKRLYLHKVVLVWTKLGRYLGILSITTVIINTTY